LREIGITGGGLWCKATALNNTGESAARTVVAGVSVVVSVVVVWVPDVVPPPSQLTACERTIESPD
jgi:hypothetical protein